MNRRCLGCATLIKSGSRCTQCKAAQRTKYHGAWPAHSRTAIAAYIAAYGPQCPGWRRDPHTVDPAALTLDHNVGVLCRACNTRKRNLGDG